MLIHVKEALPEVSGEMVEVHVELNDGKEGRAFYGTTKGSSKPQFLTVQKELAEKITHWKYLN